MSCLYINCTIFLYSIVQRPRTPGVCIINILALNMSFLYEVKILSFLKNPVKLSSRRRYHQAVYSAKCCITALPA